MPWIVAALAAAACASGAWCAVALLAAGAPAWRAAGWRAGALALALTALVGLGAALRIGLVAPHHAMYVDEPWYAEAACNLARHGRAEVCEASWADRGCAPYGKALGWPVLLVPWIALRGCDSTTGIALNRALGAGSVLLVAGATRLAGASWPLALIAAALLAIHPPHVAWSATAETNVPAAAALLAGVCGALWLLRAGRWPAAALAVTAFGLATAIRPELGVAALPAALVVASAAPLAPRRRRALGAALLLVSAAAAATALPLWTMNAAISGGAFLSPGAVWRHLGLIAHGAALGVHGAVLALALAGAWAAARGRARAAATLLAGTGLAAALAVLAYDRFDDRMLLAATVALLPLAAFAFAAPRRAWPRLLAAAAALIVVAVAWPRALRQAAAPPDTQVLETRIAARAAALSWPADALFIAEQPPVLAAAGLAPVMSTREALRDSAALARAVAGERPVYFLCDMYCEPGFAGVPSPSPCGQVLAGFAVAPVIAEPLLGRTYALYRLTGLAGADTPTPDCPRPPPGQVDSLRPSGK